MRRIRLPAAFTPEKMTNDEKTIHRSRRWPQIRVNEEGKWETNLLFALASSANARGICGRLKDLIESVVGDARRHPSRYTRLDL